MSSIGPIRFFYTYFNHSQYIYSRKEGNMAALIILAGTGLLLIGLVINFWRHLIGDLGGNCEKCKSGFTRLIKSRNNIPGGGNRLYKTVDRYCYLCCHRVLIKIEGYDDPAQCNSWYKHRGNSRRSWHTVSGPKSNQAVPIQAPSLFFRMPGLIYIICSIIPAW